MTWSAFGAGLGATTSNVYALHVEPAGDLVVSALAAAPIGTHVVRWNGVAWSSLGSPLGPDQLVLAFATLPDGDLVAGCLPGATGPANGGLARWNGSAWTPLGATVSYGVYSLAMLPSGELAAAGSYFLAGGSTIASAWLGRLRSTCPASTSVLGTGCTGSGGPNVLTARSLPWLGTTFRATATGMPAAGLTLTILGASPATIPLAAVLPVGGAGCDGLLSVLLSELSVPSGGVTSVQLSLPDAPALIGATAYQYVAALEFSPAGLVALTATNRLALTFGRF